MTPALMRCQVCRLSLLDTFASLSGISISSRAPQQLATRPAFTRKNIHTTRPRWQSLEHTSNQQGQYDNLPPLANTSSSTSDPIPWYLQVDTPAPPAPVSPLLSTYDIPPFPENSPPILQPLLEHLSVNIGLSHLNLLDLRDLSPPPALGSNLLMIIGTARSTKHLNVSADRFCRYLRTKYKLHPYADGLMGRQELKLKLRRRARRMKLAQAVGRTQDVKEAEDVTTGWVCVNVGPVPEGEVEDLQTAESVEAQEAVLDPDAEGQEEEEYENPGDNYVGFGSQSSSPRIVVQMFTEDKRVEMDLEGLWDFRSTRRERQAEKVGKAARTQEKLWREKLHEPILDLKSEDPLRDAEEENLKNDPDMNGKEIEQDTEGEETKEDSSKTQIEKEIDDPDEREEMEEEKPMGGIGAS